jgi:two-component system, NtrC family, sensor histidine kinase KinB
MSRNTRIHWITFVVLALLTAGTLLLRPPDGAIMAAYAAPLLIYGLMTMLAIYFAIVLDEGELSLAHSVGMVAFLSLPEAVSPTMTWAIALGSVAGGIALMLRKRPALPHHAFSPHDLRNVVFITARITLSFFIAGRIYVYLGGRLPLTAPEFADALRLVVFVLVYLVLYTAIFLLEVQSSGLSVRRLIKANMLEMLAALLLPIPFAVLTAEVYSSFSQISFTIFLTGLALLLIVPHGVTASQHQIRRQMNEIRSISVMSQAVSANLELDSLLNMVYIQVHNLLDVDTFIVAVIDPDESTVEYPLYIRRGQPATRQPDALSARHNLVHSVLQQSKPLLIPYNVSKRASELGLTMLDADVATASSWLGVPLVANGRLLGALAVISEQPHRHFSPDDLRLMNIVAASAGVALENARLWQTQTARVAQLATLNKVLALLTGTLSPDAVLDIIISSSSMISGATAVSVYLFEDGKPMLSIARSAGISDTLLVPPAPLPLLNTKELLGQHAQIAISDMNRDERAAPLRAWGQQAGKSAWIELPLLVGGMALGVLVMYFDEPRVFSGEMIEMLRTFTNQAAQAISNARLYSLTDEALERRVGQLLTLASISHELSATIDLDKIGYLILNHALESTHAQTGCLVLVHDRRDVELTAVHGLERVDPIYVKDTIAVDAIRSGEPTVRDAVQHAERNGSSKGGFLSPAMQAQLTVPLMRGQKVIGVLVLESASRGSFGDDDVHFAGQLANQAIIAIENARLFRRIAEARDRLQVILNTMEEGLLLIDGEGVVALASPRVEMLGLSPDAVVGQHVDTLLKAPEVRFAERLGFSTNAALVKLIKELQTSRVGREPVSYTLESESAPLHIRRLAIPVSDEDRAIGVLLVFHDETEAYDLAQAREDLSRMIIHDLRSPLTAVTTSLKLLTEFIPPESQYRPMVETTTDTSRRAIRKLLTRVDSLLDVSRMESGQMSLETKPTPLRGLVDNVRTELQPLAQEMNVEIRTDVPLSLPSLSIDADKVERVLLNLLDNALKFAPMDSAVTIRASLPGQHGAPPNFVRIDVVDEGPGVPDEYKSRLFDRFVQVRGRSGKRRGTGLGLTFCRMVSEAHGGTIWIEDGATKGSVFSFTLPIALERPELTPKAG